MRILSKLKNGTISRKRRPLPTESHSHMKEFQTIFAKVLNEKATYRNQPSFVFNIKLRSWSLRICIKLFYNVGHDILRLLDVLPNFAFITSEVKSDYW